jgi:quercetin dioxygenase-like cupin family protein
MLSDKQVQFGQLRGTVFDFEKIGDILPLHTHDDANVHITIVARGRVKAYSHDWEMTLEAGAVVDFLPNQPHEFMALEDGTRIVNLIKNPVGA